MSKDATSQKSTGVASGNVLPLAALLNNRSYLLLWIAGWSWHLSFWTWPIISGYLIFQMTGSVLLTQFVGVIFTGPLLVLGIFIGTLNDTVSRKKLLGIAWATDIGISVALGLLVLLDSVQTWHVLTITGCMGITHAFDITTRRVFVSDVAERQYLPFAYTLEGLSMTGSMMAGPWIGGMLIHVLPLGASGVGAPYIFMVFGFTVAVILLRRVTPFKIQESLPLDFRSAFNRTIQSVTALRKNRVVVGGLGVTILWNLFFASYQPLIPIFAEDVLNVGPVLMGLLGGAQGGGALLGSILIVTRRSIKRSYPYYVFGTLLSLGGLFIFSLSDYYALSFASLFIAGIGMAGFVAMQPVIVLTTVDSAHRGRAMGALSMAIGALPVGMFLVGVLASNIGPSRAVTITSLCGCISVLLWAWKFNEMRRV